MEDNGGQVATGEQDELYMGGAITVSQNNQTFVIYFVELRIILS